MTAPLLHSDLEQVYRAIHTLYSQDQSIPYADKQAASTWLNQFQHSIHAWEIADQLLHRKADLESCYFGAHTLRTKIQTSFNELPVEAHISLRDSLLQHIAAINGATDHIIATQLCLAVTHLILQANSWADPIGQLLSSFGSDPSHWWPMLEILTLLPEEVHSRKLQLGENRRHQVTHQLESAAPTVLAFLKQCLNVCLATPSPDSATLPVETCLINVVKCFGSWILINPECFFTNRVNGSGDVLSFVMGSLRDGKVGSVECSVKLHSAATDTLCAVVEVVPDMDTNNNASELQSFQIMLHGSIMSFSDAYSYAVAEEDQDKVLNYCRIFTEYGESMVPYMLRSWRDVHFSTQAIFKILDCAGHHDYEVAEMTFGFWYRLTEDLYHAHDASLNMVFREHAQRLIVALFKQCHIEPDHEGPLTSADEFYEFRKKSAEIVEDVMFMVEPLHVFQELGQLFMSESSWDAKEAALFLLYHVSKSINNDDLSQCVQPVVTAVLNFVDWRHVCLKLSAIRFLGGMARWLNKHADENLEKALNFLVSCLPSAELSNASAAALQNICQECSDQMAGKYIDNLLGILQEMDRYNVCNDAVVGLLKGVGHVVVSLPRDHIATVIRQICWAQILPLNQLCDSDTPYQKGTQADPVFWVDRLAALFRNSTSERDKDGFVADHPFKVAICEDLWPTISKVCDKYQADPRIMERVCRCLRYAVRCVGKQSHPFLEPLVVQLVNMYRLHHHSCFLYIGSILVDEYAEEAQCVEGMLQMLAAFVTPTFDLLNQPGGFRNHPDTVDDFFRLCARYITRCPVALFKSEVMPSIINCATEATQLDHRDANQSVLKFLFDIVHSGRRLKDAPDFLERQLLVRNMLLRHGELIVYKIVSGGIIALPMYTLSDITELLYEIKELMPEEASKWVEEALKKLPQKTGAGSETATLEQLQTYHQHVINARSPKEIYRASKEFIRYFK